MRYIISESQLQQLMEVKDTPKKGDTPLYRIRGEHLSFRQSQKHLAKRNNPPSKYIGNLEIDNHTIDTLGSIVEVDGEIDLEDSILFSFGDLEVVDGDLYMPGCKVNSLSKLREVTGYLDANKSTLKYLGELTNVGNMCSFRGTKIKTLNKLQTVGGFLDLRETSLEDTGELENVGHHLYLQGCYTFPQFINMKTIGGNFFVNDSPIESLDQLGNLEYIGGNFNIKRTKLEERYSDKEINNRITIKGDIIRK